MKKALVWPVALLSFPAWAVLERAGWLAKRLENGMQRLWRWANR